MKTIETFDQEQQAIDKRAEELRKQIPSREEGKKEEGKLLTPFEQMVLEKELEDLRHPQRAPEREAAYTRMPIEPKLQPQPEASAKPKGVATSEEEME